MPTTTLYNNFSVTPNTSTAAPNSPWLTYSNILVNSPFQAGTGSQSANDSELQLYTGTNFDTAAGYSNYYPDNDNNPFNGLIPTPVNSAFPKLNSDSGYTLSFTLKVVSESNNGEDLNLDGKNDRAGFSVSVVSEDVTKAIELSFEQNKIWAQGINGVTPPTSQNNLIQAESTAFDTASGFINYDLKVLGNQYTLYANGSSNPILQGSLQDYSQVSVLGVKPYGSPNLISLSDRNDDGKSEVLLRTIAVSIPDTDTTAPLVSSLSPTDDATNVALDANLVISFNELIQKGTGNIIIKKLSDQSTVEIIDVTAANVSINSNSVTINSNLNLEGGLQYYVEVPDGTFKDSSGNNYAGISNSTSWNFETSRTGTVVNDILNGSADNDTLSGLGGNDLLIGYSGNDLLNGGGGADTLQGGAGNDTYVVDNVKDLVTELALEGTDLVKSSITYTLPGNVENLTLIGTNSINGTGNNLVNIITGNIGNNIINGGGGADTFRGKAGNDTYVVDNVKDLVTELASEGTDLVKSSITYTLPGNVENLTLIGTNSINGTGNNLVNIITGNQSNNILNGNEGNDKLIAGLGNDQLIGGEGNDSLTGGAGNDSLTGGAGNDSLTGGTESDRFIYNTNAVFSTSTVGIDTLTDFNSTQADKIVLDKTTFTALNSIAGTGFSVPNDFAVVTTNTQAALSAARIVYNNTNGALFYNTNGTATGWGTGGKILTLVGIPALQASDFVLQA